METNPPDYHTPAKLSREELLAKFKEASHLIPREFCRDSYYTKVKVFAVTWTTDRTPEGYQKIDAAYLRVLTVLEKTYGYDVRRLLIDVLDVVNPMEKIRRGLAEVTRTLSSNDLLIIYYIGHGKAGEKLYNADPRLRAPFFYLQGQNTLGDTMEVSFDEILEEFVNDAPHDVFIIMDSCFASTAAIGMQGKELIAACAFRREAPYGHTGLSWNIAQLLENAASAGEILSTALLYSRLVDKAYYLREDGGVALEEVPIHANMGPARKVPILLCPLKPDSTSNRPLNSHPVQSYFPLGPVSVLLELHLDDIQSWPAERFQQWLNREGLQYQMRVLGMYHTRSFVVHVQIPVAIWYCLQPHAAIRFIAIDGGKPPKPPAAALAVLNGVDPQAIAVRVTNTEERDERLRENQPIAVRVANMEARDERLRENQAIAVRVANMEARDERLRENRHVIEKSETK